jgi:acetyl esterase
MLDKQVQQALEAARANGAPDLADVPLPVAREVYRRIMGGAGVPPAGVDARDVAAGGVPALRVYTPPGAVAAPVVLWTHGGGYVVGGVDDYDVLARQLAVDARAVVVAVGYRLAPEHPYPAAFDDAWAALKWLASPAAVHALGRAADTGRLALAGDSAGAVLALTTALRARNEGAPGLLSLGLAYPPAAGGHGDYPSRAAHAAGPTLTQRTMDWCGRLFFGGSGRAPDPRGAPLLAGDLSGLPRTLLMLAALDPLRDEGLALGARLNESGVPVSVTECHGLPHGFLSQGGFSAAARAAQRQFGRALGDSLHEA